MLILLVLILSANCARCLKVTPEMLLPIKEFNEACGYDACPIPLSEDGINVHIVPHTHYELAYQRTFAEHYTGKDRYTAPTKVNMKQTLDAVILELWSKSHRRFVLSDVAYFFHWWSQRDHTVRQMVYSLIRQGRLEFVGGGWSMNDEASTSYQAIIDSFTYSLRKINATFWKCGRPQVAWQSDVMGHSREFASLVAQMGYDALFINPISFDDELARMRRWAMEILWRGSDDLGRRSDIYTHKLFDGYWSPPGFCFSSLCTDPLLITSDSVLNNVEERVKEFMDSIYNRQSPNYNTSHVLVMMGHMHGYFDAPMWFSNIDALIDAVNMRARLGKQKMYLMYSTPACYAKAVYDSEIPLETKQDDFFPVAYDKNSFLTGFYTSFPSIKLMAREGTVYLQMCKQMRVLAELGSYYDYLFEELNWITGAFQDHTIITGSLTDDVKSYYVKKMYVAIQRSTVLLRTAWNKLRKSPTETIYYRCSFNVSRCHQLVGDTYFVVIYNPLSWSVTMPVRIPLQYFGDDFQVFDHKDDIVKSAVMKIPYPVLNIHSRVNASNCEVVFIAEDIPPIGFRSYFIQRTFPETTKVKRETKYKGKTKETNAETTNTKTTKIKPEISKTKSTASKNPPKTKRGTPDARPRRTLIKNMKRKTNKKYLIRQTNPAIEDQTLLDELDYGYETTTNTADKGNVSMLLESDFDEVKMQELSEEEQDLTTNKPENVETATVFANTTDINVNNATGIENIEIIIKTNNNKTTTKPHLWNKVLLSGRRKLDDSKSAIPNRTTTVKYEAIVTLETTTIKTLEDVAIGANKVADKPLKKEEESIIDKEGLRDIAETLIEQIKMTTEGEVSAEEELFIEATTKASVIDKEDKAVAKEITKTNEVGKLDEDITEPPILVSSTDAAAEASGVDTSTIDVSTTEKPISESKKKELQDQLMKEMTRKMFKIGNVNNTYIENKYIRITIDPASSKISAVTLSNGVHIDLDLQFYYYASDDPVALNKEGFKKPGASLFRAMENTAIPILDFIDVQVFKNPVVEEAHMVYSDWTSFVVRLYDGSPVIEVEWLVGPIPVDDKLGKEVFIRYLTNLVHDGVFYTDSNGRQNIKRIRNMRPMFDSLNTDQVAGNFYPVTSRISIQDLNSRICFSVFPDRAQGGTSLSDGEVDLMLHRRILTDDTGVGTFVNDTEYGKGAVARGKHYLYISKIDYKPYRIFEKKFAREVQLAPQVLISRPDPYGARAKEIWMKSKNEISFLKTKLPIGIQILTLEHWNGDTILLRLENILEKTDTARGQIKTVFIRELFTNIYINNVKETTLDGNMWLEDFKPREWLKKENFMKNFNDFYGADKEPEFLKDEKPVVFENVDLDKGITLSPQQIRTFVCWFDYLEV